MIQHRFPDFVTINENSIECHICIEKQIFIEAESSQIVDRARDEKTALKRLAEKKVLRMKPNELYYAIPTSN